MDIESRINELEARVAFQEQMIDELNQVVAKQDKSLMDLSRVVKLLSHQIKMTGELDSHSEIIDAPPPHY